MLPNHSPINGSELPYNSHFRNCTFAIDGDYLGTSTFFKHIDLADVNGIGFTGCDFRADRNIAGVYDYAVRCGEYVQNGKIVVTK